MNKKTIAFDFDGVIHRYSKGWQDGSIYDKPVEGIGIVIDQLRMAGYKVVVYSTRCSTPFGILSVETWLEKHKIKVDGVTDTKPIAMAYVDDRAIPFGGNCEILMREIRNFKPWTEKARKECLYCKKEFILNDISKSRNRYCSMECRKRAKEIRRKKRDLEKYWEVMHGKDNV